MFGGYYSGGVPLYPNSQVPYSRIPSSNRIYPGPTHNGYFSWSSNNNQQEQQTQANIGATVAKARLEESDIHMSHYELSVKMYLAYCYKNSNPQTAQHLMRQVHRALLDENIDHSRKVGLAVSSAIKAAHPEGKEVAEHTQMELTENRVLAKTESASQIPAKAKHTRKSSQMLKKIEYLGEAGRMPARTEPPVSYNAINIENQYGHQYGTYQTAGDRMAVDHRKPSSGNQWLIMDAQNQEISTGQTLGDETPNTFVSQDGHGCNLYGGWSTNPSTRGKAGQREIMPQEHTPLPNPIIMVDPPMTPSRKENIWSLNEKSERRQSSLLAAPFSSNNPSSNRAWSSSDLLAANFASSSSSRTSSNHPSGSSSSSSPSRASKCPSAVHSKGVGPEISRTRYGSGSYGAISSNLVPNHPTRFKHELSHSVAQPERLFEKSPSGISLYKTADESLESVDLHQGTGRGPFNHPPAPTYRLLSSSKPDVLQSGDPEHGQSIADSASACDLGHHYWYQPCNSSTYATIANTNGTSLLKEIGCGDLYVLEDDTAHAVAQIDELGGSGCGGNVIHRNVTPSRIGTGMDFANPSKDSHASDLIRQYFRGFRGPINEDHIWQPIDSTPGRPHSPIPLSTGYETMAEKLEKLAIDWEKLNTTKNSIENCNCGAHKNNTRGPLSSRVMQWLGQNLESATNQQLPNKDYLHPEANYHSDRLQRRRQN